jgi:oxygen-independent coproporphyrinogen-3 oxidase
VFAGRRARRADGSPRRCRTVFFGGGTPSLLAPEQIARLLDATRRAFVLDAGAEITMEANPGAIEYGQLDDVRGAGVNRLSFGAQSFDPNLLRWMGRIHTADEIGDAVAAARQAGFTNLNLDFIFALPGQSARTWAETLERAVALAPEHLSLYSLIVEEGTPLHRWVADGRVRPVEDDLAADMYELAAARLAAAGYIQYEISNWSTPGHMCQHNLTYWRNLPYIGLGAGAHGWYGGWRYSEARPIREYLRLVEVTCAGDAAGAPLPAGAVVECEAIVPELEMAETAMVGLRLVEGLVLPDFAARFGRTFAEALGARVADVLALGLLEERGDHLRLTERGRLLGNEVFERVLP